MILVCTCIQSTFLKIIQETVISVSMPGDWLGKEEQYTSFPVFILQYCWSSVFTTCSQTHKHIYVILVISSAEILQ